MAKIENITAYEVLDSRGNPTVQAVVGCKGGFLGSAMVPSGASTGVHEAHELRDHDEKRYGGKGVLQAVSNIKGEIHAALLGQDTANQAKIDRVLLELDGTVDKSRLGANAILAVSLACARAESAAQGLPLYLYLQQLFPKREIVMPVPQMNLINGGKHASNNLSIQEYQVLPIASTSFAEALRMGVEIHHALKAILIQEGFQVEVGDEGGFAPKLDKSESAFTLLVRAIESAGYVPGVDAYLGIDAAASEFYDSEKDVYNLDGVGLTANDLAYKYKLWRERYPIISIEDPFDQDHWEIWKQFMKTNEAYVQIVGDDLYATNVTRIRQGIMEGATNSVLIKPNQVGTLTETLQAVVISQEADQNVVVSHRSGETEDTFIADLSVAISAGQIKTGAPSRSDRTAKYNRLIQIESDTQLKLGHSLERFLAKQKTHYERAATGMTFSGGRAM